MRNPNVYRSLCIVLVLILAGVGVCDRGDYVGCYRFKVDDVLNTHTGQSADDCLLACEQVYYKYAVIGNQSTCFCGNVPGQFKLPAADCSTACPKNETQRCGGDNAASVYDTEVAAPGAPAALDLVNFTETTVRVRWTAPQAYTIITSYVIQAKVIQTFADFTLPPLAWIVSNDTFHSELLNLQPGSKYNISVAAQNDDEEGPSKTITIETLIGTPNPSPPDVVVRERHGDRMVIHIPKAQNDNGPVSMYRVVVSIELTQQGYIVDTLSNYTYAMEQGLPYYITAELDPDDIKHDFIIGDRSTYNGFYNAPLPLTNDIEVFLGVVSEKNHVKKTRYAESAKKIILNINEPEETSPVVVALGAAIAICVVLLLVGLGLLIVLRKRVTLHRQRGSQSMPLSPSEPCIEIENAGFLQEEDERIDYYGNLKRKLWNIPRNLIEIDISCVVGVGTFGKITVGKVQQGGAGAAGLVQVVPDRELDAAARRRMLQDLDAHIRASEHDNVLALVGICETSSTLFVVLQDARPSLKEVLLAARRCDAGRFSSLNEARVLQLLADVARGMDYLHAKKIYHKRLSCRNVAVGEGGAGAARVAGFGLAHARPLHEAPDYTRWTAHEMLRQTRFGPKADVWSFGVTVWEALALGGTPYAGAARGEVAARVLRGVRPSQPRYVPDAVFQLCLAAWQLDPDERPSFADLQRELGGAASSGPGALSFDLYAGFEYEPHIPQLEIES